MKKGSQSSTPATTTAERYTAGRASGGNATSYENKSQVTYSGKQSGSYARETATEKATAGEFRWKNGTSGNRSEYKQTETVRVGDKSGYTEIYNEQRVRNVTYNNNHNYGGESVVNYGGGAYSGDGAYSGGGSGHDDGDSDSACDEDDGACSDDDDACSEDGGAYSDDCDGYSDDSGACSDDDGYDSGY